MNFSPLKSLSLRLLLIFLGTAILLIFILLFQFRLGLGAQWRTNIQPHLRQYVELVEKEIGNPPNAEAAQRLADALPVEIHIYKQNQLQYSTNGIEVDLSQLRFRQLPKPPKKNRGHLHQNTIDRLVHKQPQSNPDNVRRFKSVRTVVNEAEGIQYLLSEVDDYQVLYEFDRNKRKPFRSNHLLIASTAFLGILALSYWIIRRQLSPIRKIQTGVQRMSIGELDHRIPITGQDDLSNLGDSINNMAGQIEDMLNAKRQLLLSISHELRSPLARARIASELLPESTNRERLIDDLRDMDSMIKDIMESEQLSQNHAALNIQRLNLATLFDKIVSQRPADTFNIDLPESLELDADRTRLELLLRNLLNNATEHGNREDTKIEISATEKSRTEKAGVEITIRDYGQGIDPSQISRITEPFYRPDESRTRSTGGFGMGLNLAKLIAEAHGGELVISSNPEQEPGTMVSIWLPARSTR